MESIPRSQRRDPIRPGNRLRCKVNVWPARTAIPGMSAPQPHGEGEVVIHEEDLAALEARVETDAARWAEAEVIYNRKRAEFVASAIGGNTRPDDVMSVPFDEWPPEWTKAEAAFVGSTIPGEFRNLTGHDHRPLLSVEVIETLPGEVGRDIQMAAQIAELIAPKHSNGASEERMAQLEAELAELKAQLAKALKRKD